MKKLLYVDGCIRRETSRTERLAQAFLRKRLQTETMTLETVVLENLNLGATDAEKLSRRDRGIQSGTYDDSVFHLAHQFSGADELLIAAPYWDMSFPASVKLYLEQVCINGLTFRYSSQGFPEGMVRIRKATYVTTSGGLIGDRNFGFEYVKYLLQGLFGVQDVRFLSAEGLDLWGHDPEQILASAIAEVQRDL